MLVVLLITLAAVLAGLWFLFAGPRASSAPSDPQRAPAAEPSARPAEVDLEAPSRSEVVPADPATGGTATAPTRSEALTRFSGRFVFEDGSIPPEMGFRMEIDPRDASEGQDCLRRIRERTDAQAAFVVEGLCPGAYTIQPGISGLPRVEGTVQVPATGARVVLSGYLLRVRVRARRRHASPAQHGPGHLHRSARGSQGPHCALGFPHRRAG